MSYSASDLVIQRGTDKKSAHATRKFPNEEVHINHHRAKHIRLGPLATVAVFFVVSVLLRGCYFRAKTPPILKNGSWDGSQTQVVVS